MSPSSTSPEYTDVQVPALELLRDHYGYRCATGASAEIADARGSDTEVLLLKRLEKQLVQINPGLTETGVKQAVSALRQPVAAGVLDANEACHRLLSRWVTVEESRGGKLMSPSVRYIDFDQPENNDFLVVEELSVRGPRYTRRLDLVIFVNGIPLVVVECKQPGDPHGLEHGIGDLLAYQDAENGVARLFHTVQFCLALTRNDARYGTIGTSMDRYTEWKSVYPDTLSTVERDLGRKPTPQDVTLCGLLRKENLLDHLRNFVVFDREGAQVVKKVARYQQFEAVNQALARITDSVSDKPMRERGGVVWHTQGSGKSLTMLWLCLKMRRETQLENPTLLVVTDRRGLDRQITKTFQTCGFENPVRAARISHLRQVLNGPPGQTIMTTIHKFSTAGDETAKASKAAHPVLSDADNVFLLIDEAHRSQYKWLGANLRQALPNACHLAFTGTPIVKTRDTFGSYIHTYTMPQSVEDGATVPILYESRLPELAIWGKQLNPLFETAFAHLSKEQREKLKKQEITERKIAESASERTAMIARDIAAHYAANFEPDGFKAQVATCSQKHAAQYYHELNTHFPGRVAILISDPSRKNSPLWALRQQFADEEAIIDTFTKESADKLAVLVVADKYLTGFDAPVEGVLYLDKPLREHNLLQAIARVNRPLPEKDKEWGLVVDYWGVAGFLDKALAAFSTDLGVDDVMKRRDDDAQFQILKQRHADVLALFPEGLDRQDIEPWIMELEPEDRRALFRARHADFYRALERLLPDQRALAYLKDFAWLRRVRQEAQTFFESEDLQLPDCAEKVRALIDRHVKGEDVRVLLKPVPILDQSFSEELRKLHSSRAKASRIAHAIRRTITVRLEEDPVFYESIRDRLERIIFERKKKRMDDTEEFQQLLELSNQVRDGVRERARKFGIDENAVPFYSVLSEGDGLEMAEESEAYGGDTEEHLAHLADSILQVLKENIVLDWQHKEDVQRDMRRQIKRLLRRKGLDASRLEELTARIMELARVRLT